MIQTGLGDELFQPTEASGDSAPPALYGGRCNSCGYVFFPPQSYGCERCGSTKIDRTELDGRGTLIASAVVHRHLDPARPAPFIVGSMELEQRVVVRGLIEAGQDALAPGCPMETLIVAETRPDRGATDIRFRPAI